MQIKLNFKVFVLIISLILKVAVLRTRHLAYLVQWVNHHIPKSWYETQIQWIEYETELKDLKSSPFINQGFWQNVWS